MLQCAAIYINPNIVRHLQKSNYGKETVGVCSGSTAKTEVCIGSTVEEVCTSPTTRKNKR